MTSRIGPMCIWNGSAVLPKTTIDDVNAMVAQLGLVSGNISADPAVDSSWHLTAGSPCIDTGTTTDAPARDFEGDTRPQGTAPDIGPDEAN
jgi:hypothetical protein